MPQITCVCLLCVFFRHQRLQLMLPWWIIPRGTISCRESNSLIGRRWLYLYTEHRANIQAALVQFINYCTLYGSIFYILFFWCCCWRHRCRMMMALFGDSISSPRSISNYHHHYHKHMEIMEWTIWNWNERIGLPPNAAAYSEDKKTKRKKKLNANSNDP